MRTHRKVTRSFHPLNLVLEGRHPASVLIPGFSAASGSFGVAVPTDRSAEGFSVGVTKPGTSASATRSVQAAVPPARPRPGAPVPGPVTPTAATTLGPVLDTSATPAKPVMTPPANAILLTAPAQPLSDGEAGGALAPSMRGDASTPATNGPAAALAAPPTQGSPTGVVSPAVDPTSAQAARPAPSIRRMSLAPNADHGTTAGAMTISGGSGGTSGGSGGGSGGSGGGSGGSGGSGATSSSNINQNWGSGGYPGGWAIQGSGGGGATGWGSAAGSGSSSASLSSPQHEATLSDGSVMYIVNSGGGANKQDGSGIDTIGGIGGVYFSYNGPDTITSQTIYVENAVSSRSESNEAGATDLVINNTSEANTAGEQWYWNSVAGWNPSDPFNGFQHQVKDVVTVTSPGGSSGTYTLLLNNKVEAPRINLDPTTGRPLFTATAQPLTLVPGSDGNEYLTGDTAQSPGIYFNATVNTSTFSPQLASSRYNMGYFWFEDTVIPNDVATLGGINYKVGPTTPGVYMINNDTGNGTTNDIPQMNKSMTQMVFPGQQGTMPGQVSSIQYQVSPKMANDNPGFRFTWYTDSNGVKQYYVTQYQMNDTFVTNLIYASSSGISYSIGSISWSMSATATYNGANWSLSNVSQTAPTVFQGVAGISLPSWSGDANTDLNIAKM